MLARADGVSRDRIEFLDRRPYKVLMRLLFRPPEETPAPNESIQFAGHRRCKFLEHFPIGIRSAYIVPESTGLSK